VKKTYANEPLLYVLQPDSMTLPKCHMQAAYNSSFHQNNEETRAITNVASRSFKQLSIQEKIAYIVRARRHLLQLKCKITVAEITHIGTIINHDAKSLTIIDQTKGRRTVNVQQITNIELVSL